MVKICSECQHKNEDRAVICINCGEELKIEFDQNQEIHESGKSIIGRMDKCPKCGCPDIIDGGLVPPREHYICFRQGQYQMVNPGVPPSKLTKLITYACSHCGYTETYIDKFS